jgi:hypothetical protein
MMICSVVSGYPVPTGLAMVGVLRRRWCHFRGRWWRRHILWGRRSGLLRRRRRSLLRTCGQADDRQGGDDRYDKGFHERRSSNFRKPAFIHWLTFATSLFTLRLIACRVWHTRIFPRRLTQRARAYVEIGILRYVSVFYPARPTRVGRLPRLASVESRCVLGASDGNVVVFFSPCVMNDKWAYWGF